MERNREQVAQNQEFPPEFSDIVEALESLGRSLAPLPADRKNEIQQRIYHEIESVAQGPKSSTEES